MTYECIDSLPYLPKTARKFGDTVTGVHLILWWGILFFSIWIQSHAPFFDLIEGASDEDFLQVPQSHFPPCFALLASMRHAVRPVAVPADQFARASGQQY